MEDGLGLIIAYVFVLTFLLIAVAYYAGFKSNVQVLGNALNQLLLTVQGRTQSGQFAGYPSGAGQTNLL